MISKILMTEFVTHDVKRFIVEKSEDFTFIPGQATEMSISEKDWNEKRRPFTFTNRNEDEVLEFTIKIYPSHDGFTKKINELEPGDELIIRKPWGTINYKGPGVFIAGGAGITPFIAIFRDLKKTNGFENSSLIFSNKESKDVILEKELRSYFGQNCNFILTEDEVPTCSLYENAYIDKDYLKNKISDFSQNFYVCGPPGFVKDMNSYLKELGAFSDSLVFEK